MILILVPEITPRVEYTFNYIFHEILRCGFQLSKDQQYFEKHEGPKFSYAPQSPSNLSPWIKSTNLLFENSLEDQRPELSEWENIPTIFPVTDGLLPFDIFAATFYLITRYEEYLPHKSDLHTRYEHKNSIAYKGRFLELPVINIWCENFRSVLNKNFSLNITKPPFTFIPTLDIDNAYAYKHKGLGKNLAKFLISLLKRDFKGASRRVKVIFNLEQDPFDSYEKFVEVNRRYALLPRIFVLLGNKTRYDRNLSFRNPAYRKLIQTLSAKAIVGIHPSYGSNKKFKQLKTEKFRLESILKRNIEISRQHFIKLKLPQTYQNLIKLGIKEDFSMGYTNTCGYRAGTSTPFYFFDLSQNSPTNLKIFPFAFMDTTLKVKMKKSSTEIIPYIEKLCNPLKGTGGSLTFIFHNESIGGRGIWRNWGSMYEKIIQKINSLHGN